MRFTRATHVALLATCALVVGGGVAFASIPNSSGTISACYGKVSGVMRVIDPAAGQACTKYEVALTLNQSGPAGAVGPAGPAGAAGAAGADGTDGATGAMGAAGTGLVMRGDFVAHTGDYIKGDVVRFQGTSWVAIKTVGNRCDVDPDALLPNPCADIKWGDGEPHVLAVTPGAPGADSVWQVLAQDGSRGTDGAPGAAGADGATGTVGPIGLTGPAGPAGADGIAGPIGLTGLTGQTGAVGPQGPAGPPGVAGGANTTVVNTKQRQASYYPTPEWDSHPTGVDGLSLETACGLFSNGLAVRFRDDSAGPITVVGPASQANAHDMTNGQTYQLPNDTMAQFTVLGNGYLLEVSTTALPAYAPIGYPRDECTFGIVMVKHSSS